MRKELASSVVLVFAIVLCAACGTTRSVANFNGLSTPDGIPLAHLNTPNLAPHLPAFRPLLGDATLQATVGDFTAAAKRETAANVHIVQSGVFACWFVLPPVSFVPTPVGSNVAGDALP